MVGQSLKKFNFQDCPLGICTYDVGLEEIFQQFLQVSQSITCGNFIFLSFLYPPCYIDSVNVESTILIEGQLDNSNPLLTLHVDMTEQKQY